MTPYVLSQVTMFLALLATFCFFLVAEPYISYSNVAQAWHDVQAAYHPASSTPGRREILFLDPNIDHHQSLITSLASQVEVVYLATNRDGLEQIATVLAERQRIDALHILAHGAPGELQLGSSRLVLHTVPTAYANAFAVMRQALAPEGDVLIYGCNFAAGERLRGAVANLAMLTGADIAASNDLTGAHTLGGDWDLEVKTGAIESAITIPVQTQMQYAGVLDITTGLEGHWTFDVDATDAGGNLRHGTLQNGVAINTTPSSNIIGGGKLRLDGTNDFVSLSAHASDFDNFTEGTISAWIRSTGGTQMILSASNISDEDSDVSFRLDSSGHLEYDVFEDESSLLEVETTAVINDGTWHHVAVVIHAGDNTLYIDGLAAPIVYNQGNASTSRFFDDMPNLDSMSIGRNENDEGGRWFFSGFIRRCSCV